MADKDAKPEEPLFIAIMNEEETRNRLIRPAIARVGWKDIQIREEFPYTLGRIHVAGNKWKRGDRKKIDFLLEHSPGVPIAIVEAKHFGKPLGDGMQQALGYAEALDVPFVFSSNGEGFLFHDKTGMGVATEQKLTLDQFPSPEELHTRFVAWKEKSGVPSTVLTTEFQNEDPLKSDRYYQRIAVDKAVEAFAVGQRRLLLVMATGTGKTRVASQIIWRLKKLGRIQRVLFLADRNVLVDQAKGNDFSHFGSAITKITRPNFVHTGDLMAHEVFVGIYQALTGPSETDKLFKKLPPDFFDLIVIDECHRGGASLDSEWHEILDYFTSAAHLGLTATPKETADVSTTHYFGDALYTYSLKQGIDDGFLAPYKVLRVLLDNDITGWRPFPGMVDDTGNAVEDRIYEIKDVNRSVIFPQRDALVAKKIIEYLDAIGDPYAKTIVFCRTTEHAERMRSALMNAAGPRAQESTKYAMRITGDDEEGKMQIDTFTHPDERFPTIATTSQLLSTGVDTQTVKLIVLDKPIESMTEFKQIIGRGTRVREDKGKTWFTIMDFQGATKLFADPAFDGVPERVFEVGENDDIGAILATKDPQDEPVEQKEKEDELVDLILRVYGPALKDRPPVYTVSNVSYAVVKEQVQYLGADGKLITESLTDFTRKNILDHYPTLENFFDAWQEATSRQAIIDEISASGIPLEELQKQVGAEFDLFDLIMHVAYDKRMMKKRDRADALRRSNYLDKWSGKAREVIEALLDKYADIGFIALDEIETVKTPPVSYIGEPLEVLEWFGGREAFAKTLDEIADTLATVKVR
ncbi:MAG: DEAD/DEAH box helicase family protein [Patescibacteria group bacterium]